MWPLVFSAKGRALSPEEVAELRRLAELVKRGLASRPGFNERAGALCDAVHSQVLGAGGRTEPELEEILEEIDRLRGILDS
jgi:hypothetical protein